VSRFSECFLLLFGQLAVGGLIGLAVPPFTVLDRGFYRSSAGIFLGFALLFLAGKIALVVRAGTLTTGDVVELACWTSFTVALGVYLFSLWRDSNTLRARAFLAGLVTGLAALVISAASYRLGPVLSPGTLLYPLAFVSAALALGAVATGMLLGHWYLIDLGLSIDPLQRLFRWFMFAVVLQLVVGFVTVVVLAITSPDGAAAIATLWHDHRALLVTRLVLGPGAALTIGYLIHRTLAIPQTMAATGLFYVAILAVMIGEVLGRLILFRTSLPL
jgi:hypothetical protein